MGVREPGSIDAREEVSVRRIVVLNSVSLDGVMQAPGRPDEDTRDGFRYGGWAVPYADDVATRAFGAHMGGGGWLLGRRTYEDVLAYWNSVPDSPFAETLNNAPKYVVSNTLTEPLPWPNSTLLSGDVIEAVASLKQEPGGDLNIMGSGALIRSLMPHDLIDEFMLTITPVVLGEGHRLFGEGTPLTRLQLMDAETTTTGAVIATYRRVAEPRS
jgi:dihydrofolate reductase